MFTADWMMMLFLLVVGHCMADYALQSDFMANAKNRNTEVGKVFWKHVLFAHATIHGGFVAVITGLWFLGVLEIIAHFLIDWAKCESKISLNLDQALHYICKLAWLAITYAVVTW